MTFRNDRSEREIRRRIAREENLLALAIPIRDRVSSSYAGGTSGEAIPKEPRLEIPRLREMMRRPGQTCLMQIPGVCPGGLRDDTCGAHGNSAKYGKAMAMKAHDAFLCRSCARCHQFVDSSYRATGEERQAAWIKGHWRQIAEWQRDVKDASLPARDRAAIALALHHLAQLGYLT